jgi:putative hydrolase of the HAD superfamily
LRVEAQAGMATAQQKPSAVFVDIGGVLLTNGWDRHARRRAAEAFGLDFEEMDERHHLTFDTYEEGKLSLDSYLDRTVFNQARPFTRQEFRSFMFSQSQPLAGMIEFFRRLKADQSLRLAAISNEGRELLVYRIQHFGLHEFIDFFVGSAFVHFRKPDIDIFHIALDLAQVEPAQAVYIDDRAMFVEVARSLGMSAIHHTHLNSTQQALGQLGLELEQP